MNSNPLLSPQREKSGSSTFSKYGYQYHWALYKALDHHNEKKEYAVFLEYHEDVVIASSLVKEEAKFEFNQVKAVGRRYTEIGLTKVTKKKPSVLGKLVGTCLGKDYSELISKINLVSTGGFNLPLKEPDLDFEVLQISDIAKSSLDTIEVRLINEIECQGLPENLQFVIPRLQEKGYQSAVIGKISILVKTLYPSSNCDAVDIYRTLIDELQLKGKNTFDYKNWNDALKNKSLTSQTVTEVLNSFTSMKDEVEIRTEFNAIASEIGLNTIKRKALRNAFNRYRNRKIGARNSNQINITKSIVAKIKDNITICNDNIETLLMLVSAELNEKVKGQFPQENDLMGAIICEYLMLDYEE